MEKKHYLLLKQHNTTGMKYLCYHRGDDKSCLVYKGSGLYWKKHLEKHGSDISTIILKESDDRLVISEEGKKYSIMWDVIESKEFANLIIEDANFDTSRFRTVKSKRKRGEALRARWLKDGMSDKEKIARSRGIAAMRTPENMEKAATNLRNRMNNRGYTEKELARGMNKKLRISEQGFTEKELAYFDKISKRQMGKNMRERLNNPNYIDPRKGKNAIEIYGENYVSPLKGYKHKEHNPEYISASAKPFKVIINHKYEHYYSSEADFKTKMKTTQKMMETIKRKGIHIIKRQSNSTHDFNNGDVLEYFPLSIKEYNLSRST